MVVYAACFYMVLAFAIMHLSNNNYNNHNIDHKKMFLSTLYLSFSLVLVNHTEWLTVTTYPSLIIMLFCVPYFYLFSFSFFG